MTAVDTEVRSSAPQCVFAPLSGEEDAAPPAGRQVLGRVDYGFRSVPPGLRGGVPAMGVHMASEGADPFTELWLTDRPVRPGEDRGLVYAEDGEHLFCAVRVAERGVYREAVRRAYAAAFALLVRRGYPRLLRMWNLVGAITGGNAEGMENYRDFCIGRARAFDEWREHIGRVPAATGIGARGPGIDMYLLARRAGAPLRHLENPYQTPAYRYPRRYGPKAPSFARATWSDGTLYVSGTASIVGDGTVHRGDVERQCDVTFANIGALIGEENLARHGVAGGFRLGDLDHVKVYVRDAAHLPAVRARCAELLHDRAEVRFLNVDVCRPDLLVEIEGICR
ncbi:FkbO/Hyg5 family chorismatase [Streptomyces sp. URMC 125]|uniref:FkbO/Hyg5 family chorismatase n=1 Tax=Streptomyces sp. URMC 125 TaxID=3423419 RepID=UPI003F19EECE